MLTESEVERSFRKMFNGGEVDPSAYDRAEDLIDQLRPESPLRIRLTTELDEIRQMHASAKS